MTWSGWQARIHIFKEGGKVHKPEDGIYLGLNDKASVVEENV